MKFVHLGYLYILHAKSIDFYLFKIKSMSIPKLPKEGRRLVSRHEYLNKDLYYDDGACSLNAHTPMKPDQANLQ